MVLDIALIGASMATAFATSLKNDSARLKALGATEAEKFAASIATIGKLLAEGQIDEEEAQVLIDIQKNATASVLSSLAGISAVAARRATHAALASVVSSVDTAIGVPLIATALKT